MSSLTDKLHAILGKLHRREEITATHVEELIHEATTHINAAMKSTVVTELKTVTDAIVKAVEKVVTDALHANHDPAATVENAPSTPTPAPTGEPTQTS